MSNIMRLKKKSPDAVTEGVVASRDNGKSASSFVSFTYRTGDRVFCQFSQKIHFWKENKKKFHHKDFDLRATPNTTIQCREFLHRPLLLLRELRTRRHRRRRRRGNSSSARQIKFARRRAAKEYPLLLQSKTKAARK